MQQTTIALGLVTTRDIATARRLHDYGDLDDDGVAAALEQMMLQRSGSDAFPSYLTCIQQVAAVIDNGNEITLASFEAANWDDEHGILTSLFALLPAANARAVVWHGADWPLLLRRAFRHALPAPAILHAAPCYAWDAWFTPQNGGVDHAVQADVIRLYGNDDAAVATLAPALRAAIHWYDMDLRWRCVSGDIDAATRRARRARVLAQARTDAAPRLAEGDC